MHHLHNRFVRQMSCQFFFCASAKLTHRYNTHANQPKIMEHLEQENRELKDEIARLTTLMESVIAAQNQSSPTPATKCLYSQGAKHIEERLQTSQHM